MRAMYVFQSVMLVVCHLALNVQSLKAAKIPNPTRDSGLGKCNVDADCKAFPGTVCVLLTTGDYQYGKCTPNVDSKPVCRGGQAGLCPQYQTSTQGYLNAQCVLIDKAMQPATGENPIVPVDQKSSAGSLSAPKTTKPKDTKPTTKPSTKPTTGSKSDRRQLKVSSSAGSSTGAGDDLTPPSDSTTDSTTPSTTNRFSTTKISSLKCPSDGILVLSDPKCWFNTEYKNVTITVQYKCVDYDMCLEQSAASQAPQSDKEKYCRPKGCVSGSKELCNNRGTCQGNSPVSAMRPESYSCRCYAGYTGSKCEKSVDASCDVDCGLGGACINNTCTCYEGWIGKDLRCSKCTSDVACENGNKCDVPSGKCQCADGYVGTTCGGKTDPCIGVTCSDGGTCRMANKLATCYCHQCAESGDCKQCNDQDCSAEICPANITSNASPLKVNLQQLPAAYLCSILVTFVAMFASFF